MQLPDEPLAPDFYDYHWHPLVRAVLDGEFVVTEWADGQVLRAHGWWLRESIVADGATDPTTREGTLDPAHIDEDLTVTEITVSNAGDLRRAWTDGLSGALHPGWLRHVADQSHRPDAWLPAHEPWTTDTLSRPPTFDGPAVPVDDEPLTEWLRALVRFGIGRLVGLPTDEATVLQVTDRIGAILA
jgi:gamma-butyrobetaine dioxygenase